MYKTLFTKKSVRTLSRLSLNFSNQNGPVVPVIEDIFDYANRVIIDKNNLARQNPRKMATAYLIEQFNNKYDEFSTLQKKGASFSTKQETITDLTHLSDIIMTELRSECTQNISEKISEIYLTAADMEMTVNSFLPSKKTSIAEIKTKIVDIEEMIKKSLDAQPENEKAKLALIEFKYSFQDLLNEQNSMDDLKPMKKC